MKKILILLGIFALGCEFVYANEVNTPKNPEQRKANIQKKVENFDKKLNLTEEQKKQAKELRIATYKKILLIKQNIAEKKQEAKTVKQSKLAPQAQQVKLVQIHKEIKLQEKKIRELRKQNMKDFEALLTDEQKQVLKQMKKDGRKEYRKKHPPRFVPIMPLDKQSKENVK